VRNILTNELLIGTYVFNRTSQPLKGRRRLNPPEAWIRTKVLEPVISGRCSIVQHNGCVFLAAGYRGLKLSPQWPDCSRPRGT
jgi:hypothetical protein